MRDAKVRREGMRGVGAWGWMRLTCGMRFVRRVDLTMAGCAIIGCAIIGCAIIGCCM